MRDRAFTGNDAATPAAAQASGRAQSHARADAAVSGAANSRAMQQLAEWGGVGPSRQPAAEGSVRARGVLPQRLRSPTPSPPRESDSDRRVRQRRENPAQQCAHRGVSLCAVTCVALTALAMFGATFRMVPNGAAHAPKEMQREMLAIEWTRAPHGAAAWHSKRGVRRQLPVGQGDLRKKRTAPVGGSAEPAPWTLPACLRARLTCSRPHAARMVAALLSFFSQMRRRAGGRRWSHVPRPVRRRPSPSRGRSAPRRRGVATASATSSAAACRPARRRRSPVRRRGASGRVEPTFGAFWLARRWRVWRRQGGCSGREGRAGMGAGPEARAMDTRSPRRQRTRPSRSWN